MGRVCTGTAVQLLNFVKVRTLLEFHLDLDCRIALTLAWQTASYDAALDSWLMCSSNLSKIQTILIYL